MLQDIARSREISPGQCTEEAQMGRLLVRRVRDRRGNAALASGQKLPIDEGDHDDDMMAAITTRIRTRTEHSSSNKLIHWWSQRGAALLAPLVICVAGRAYRSELESEGDGASERRSRRVTHHKTSRWAPKSEEARVGE